MAIEVWEPKHPAGVTLEQLTALSAQMVDADLSDLGTVLDKESIKRDATLMTQTEESWEVAAALSDDDIVVLIRFFTLAEMQLAGWEAGKRSPVVPLVKILKSRGVFTPELRKWVKANTDNRYLPNGAAL
ncbi:MAG: hypothetical protein VX745_04985 [Pseudomonadota bacterium]|nr:hypothetical protein [Pseudomonadota bacterium]